MNNKIIAMLVCGLTVTLTGCSYTMIMAPRDGGGAYTGSVQGSGSGNVSIQLDNFRVCNGVFGKTYSSDTFGYLSAYGNRGQAVSASGMTIGGADSYKVVMSCSDGTTIRCDVQGKSSGGGVCVDSKNRVYDLIYQ